MKLQIRDRQAELDGVAAQDPLDIIQKSMDTTLDIDDDVLLWLRPAHLDTEEQMPDPTIAAEARSEGVNVERVLSREVGASPSPDDSDGDDGDQGGDSHAATASGTAGTSGGNDDTPLPSARDYQVGSSSQGQGTERSIWTEEQDFTHATQDADHGAHQRTYDIGSYDGSGYGYGYGTMSVSGSDIDVMSQQLGSMSLTPEGSEASFPYNEYPPPMQPTYYQPMLIVEPPQLFEDSRTRTLSDGRRETVRAAPGYPMHNCIISCSQFQYDMHLQNYLSNYSMQMSWYEYCLVQTQQPHIYQEPRHSMWN